MGKSWGKHGKIIGTSWEHHGNIMGTSWENHGKTPTFRCLDGVQVPCLSRGWYVPWSSYMAFFSMTSGFQWHKMDDSNVDTYLLSESRLKRKPRV